MSLIVCQECGKPWGIVGDDREALRHAIALWWHEEYDAMRSPDWPELAPLLPELPPFTETTIVHVTEASGTWLSDRIGCEVFADLPCWMEVIWMDAPEWWTTPRSKVALRWECCQFSFPRKVMK